jgi:hypothetical protein
MNFKVSPVADILICTKTNRESFTTNALVSRALVFV